MELTLQLPDELASNLRECQEDLPRILELGWAAWQSESTERYSLASEVIEKLASLPSPEEILAIRPSPQLEQRVGELLAKNRTSGLSPDERREWQHFEYLEHIVRMAKARAALRLQAAS